MEKMPYQSELDTPMTTSTHTSPMEPTQRDVIWSDWRSGLPVLAGDQVVLRELRTSDAASLFSLLTTEEVARFISPPPTSVDGFERFIAWTHRQRTAGVYACYAITLKGYDTAIGIFQVRETEQGFGTGEWGFALGSPFWNLVPEPRTPTEVKRAYIDLGGCCLLHLCWNRGKKSVLLDIKQDAGRDSVREAVHGALRRFIVGARRLREGDGTWMPGRFRTSRRSWESAARSSPRTQAGASFSWRSRRLWPPARTQEFPRTRSIASLSLSIRPRQSTKPI